MHIEQRAELGRGDDVSDFAPEVGCELCAVAGADDLLIGVAPEVPGGKPSRGDLGLTVTRRTEDCEPIEIATLYRLECLTNDIMVRRGDIVVLGRLNERAKSRSRLPSLQQGRGCFRWR